MDPNPLGPLKRKVRTEMELARNGEIKESVMLLMRDGELPLALLTDSVGVQTPKVLDFLDLLTCLDRSTTLEGLEKLASRSISLPRLPKNTLFADVAERTSGRLFAVTGCLEAMEHVFVLGGSSGDTTHLLRLPPVVYRAVWREEERRLESLSITLCSPDLSGGELKPDTEIYRWPFSNVHDQYRGALEGACWPTIDHEELELWEAPVKGVLRFVGIPNNGDLFGRRISQNSEHGSYRQYLQSIEKEGFKHDYLIPCAMTVEDLHRQRRRP